MRSLLFSKPKFNPKHLRGLKLWLDARAISGIADGGNVATWPDISGNGYNATQGTSAARPSYVANELNGFPVVRFDGTDDVMTLVSGALGLFRNISGATLFAVVKYPGTSANAYALYASTNTTSSRISFHQNSSGVYSIGGRRLDSDSFESANSSASVTNNFVIHGGVIDYANAKAYNYINGALDGTDDPYQTAGNTSDTNSAGIAIGANSSGALGFLNGDIAEVIVYNRALSSAELTAVHRYLSAKWGIALA